MFRRQHIRKSFYHRIILKPYLHRPALVERGLITVQHIPLTVRDAVKKGSIHLAARTGVNPRIVRVPDTVSYIVAKQGRNALRSIRSQGHGENIRVLKGAVGKQEIRVH
jgi:hypothetical protein